MVSGMFGLGGGHSDLAVRSRWLNRSRSSTTAFRGGRSSSRLLVPDHFGFEQRVERFGDGVLVEVSAAPTRGNRAGIGEALGATNGSLLRGFNRSMQHLAIVVSATVRGVSVGFAEVVERTGDGLVQVPVDDRTDSGGTS